MKMNWKRILNSQSRNSVIVLALVLPLFPAFSSGVTDVKLNTNTSPSTGVAGSTDVWITGSGFPSGTITPADVKITLNTTCTVSKGTSAATLAVRSVVGTTYRIEFKVPVLCRL